MTEILNFEKIRGIKLPDDLINFYSYSNGLESAEDMFRIIPLDEMFDNMKDRDTYTVEQNDFHFAEYMIYCDIWTININSDDSNDYRIYNKADNVITLTNSFSEFLDTFLNGGVFNDCIPGEKMLNDWPNKTAAYNQDFVVCEAPAMKSHVVRNRRLIVECYGD